MMAEDPITVSFRPRPVEEVRVISERRHNRLWSSTGRLVGAADAVDVREGLAP